MALSCPRFKCWPLDLQSTCWPTSLEHPYVYQFTRLVCKQLCQRQNGDREVVAVWNCAFDSLFTHQKCSQFICIYNKIKKEFTCPCNLYIYTLHFLSDVVLLNFGACIFTGMIHVLVQNLDIIQCDDI